MARVWLKKARNRLQARSAAVRVDVLSGYAQWAKAYPAEAHNPLMEIEQRAMFRLLPPVKGKMCLDLACGSGRYLRLLREQGAGQVFGSDYSAEMLAQARLTNPEIGLVRCPFLALPFATESFDLITCALGVGHEANLHCLLAEAGRLLRPGGSLLYSDFHPFAALNGWQRTFIANGITFSLEHYIHLYADHLHACRAAGLTIEAVLEPAGGPHAPAQFARLPVVLVIRAVKNSRGTPA